tara:strand:+ start:240 stop:1235 length:996 start_codon:yes stop_codon:yes gene_type:complete
MRNILNSITIGDPEGVGLELIFKIWIKYKNSTGLFFIIGDIDYINRKIKKLNFKIKTKSINDIDGVKLFFDKFLPVLNIKSSSMDSNTLDALNISYKLATKKLISGIVTLPLNKERIKLISNKFVDQTNFFMKKSKKDTNMILYSKKIITSPITNHIALKNVSKNLTKTKLIKKINEIIECLQQDFKIKKPTIGVSGLNPHSGENGNFGKEEINIIRPAISYFQRKKINIHGPIPPDSIFIRKNINKYDCIITMYHDQSLIPFKIIDFHGGVNFTSCNTVIRTSPCHGTAYDIVGKKIANEESLLNAIKLANKIYKNRYNNEKIIRSKFFN